MDKVMMVKPGVLELKIGSGVIRRLHEVLNFIGSSVSAEEIAEYTELFKKGTQADAYPKEWMKHVYNISFLAKVCEDAAVTQDLTFEKDLDAEHNTLESLLNEDKD